MTKSLSLSIFSPPDGEAWTRLGGCSAEEEQVVPLVVGTITRNAMYTVKLWQVMLQLCSKLRDMPLLESFSLAVSKHPDNCKRHDFHVPGRIIRSLLEALPLSLTNLELDNRCIDSVSQKLCEEDHICLTLKRILPGLHNARVRLARICEEVLPDSGCGTIGSGGITSGLGSGNTLLLTTLNEGWDTAMTRHCTWQERSFITRAPAGFDPKLSLCDCLVPKLKAAITNGGLCNFGRCLVYDIRNPPQSQQKPRLQFPTICERSLGSSDNVHLSPFIFVQTIGSALTKEPFALRHIASGQKDIEVIGDRDQLIRKLEDDAWVETMSGLRLSSNYLKQSTRCHSFTLKPLLLFDRTAIPGFKHKLKLWDIEDREGSTLLSGQALSGLNHSLCVSRELTQTEVRHKLRREAIQRGEVVEKTNFSVVESATVLDPQHMFSDEDEYDYDVTEDSADDNAVEYPSYNAGDWELQTFYSREDDSDGYDSDGYDGYDSSDDSSNNSYNGY